MLENLCEWQAGEVENRCKFVFTAETTGISALGSGSCLPECQSEKIYRSCWPSSCIIFYLTSHSVSIQSNFDITFKRAVLMDTRGFATLVLTRCVFRHRSNNCTQKCKIGEMFHDCCVGQHSGTLVRAVASQRKRCKIAFSPGDFLGGVCMSTCACVVVENWDSQTFTLLTSITIHIIQQQKWLNQFRSRTKLR